MNFRALCDRKSSKGSSSAPTLNIQGNTSTNSQTHHHGLTDENKSGCHFHREDSHAHKMHLYVTLQPLTEAVRGYAHKHKNFLWDTYVSCRFNQQICWTNCSMHKKSFWLKSFFRIIMLEEICFLVFYRKKKMF